MTDGNSSTDAVEVQMFLSVSSLSYPQAKPWVLLAMRVLVGKRIELDFGIQKFQGSVFLNLRGCRQAEEIERQLEQRGAVSKEKKRWLP